MVFLITTQAQEATLPPPFLTSAQSYSRHPMCVALKIWPGRGNFSVPGIPCHILCSDDMARHLDGLCSTAARTADQNLSYQ